MWGTLHKHIFGQGKIRMTAELMHYKRHGWSRNSRANQTAEIHEVALMFKKIIQVTCMNLVGITCENRRTTTDSEFTICIIECYRSGRKYTNELSER